jgi:hypothetical protein
VGFAEDIENELTLRLDAASMLVNEARIEDDAAARWFAMYLEVSTALKDAILEVAHKLDEMAPGAGD